MVSNRGSRPALIPLLLILSKPCSALLNLAKDFDAEPATKVSGAQARLRCMLSEKRGFGLLRGPN